MASKGIFGKLPAHGDFVQRNLPGSFITPWDEWLQRAVHGVREVIGEQWLDYYLTSPIWRFAFSAGVIDAHAWSGILVPSVDSVGRYFPVTLAASRPSTESPFSLMRDDTWYQALSDLAIEALQHSLQVDQVLARFPELSSRPPAVTCEPQTDDVITLSGGSTPADCYPMLLDKLLEKDMRSFSLWWCSGSQHLAPTTKVTAGLPDASVYSSMLGAPEFHW
ncbi:type VI secretion system-associated protein TagF [uncultured Microbulbifer sp.]|uniref:type VI secretion system-associated protein TagF n=1 Tax=uncultured Microbulbifer sp. TaxID=348147 RepID=UPI00262E43E9|nr:type VI secretion system-associated protein TagF [uncultured Microbulbifer sp.]